MKTNWPWLRVPFSFATTLTMYCFGISLIVLFLLTGCVGSENITRIAVKVTISTTPTRTPQKSTKTPDERFVRMTQAIETRVSILTASPTPTHTQLPIKFTQEALATRSAAERIMEALPDRSNIAFEIGKWKIVSTDKGLFLTGLEDGKRIDFIYSDRFGISSLGDTNYKASFIKLSEDGIYLYMGLIPPYWDTNGDYGYSNTLAVAQLNLTNGEMKYIFPENLNSENTKHYVYTANISPSGDLLVYNYGPRFIRFINLNNNQKFHTVFGSDYDQARGFKWSPDGTKMLYIAGVWFNSPMDPYPIKESLFLLDLDTMKTSKLIDDAGLFGDYSFSISDDLVLTIESLRSKTSQDFNLNTGETLFLSSPTP